MKLFGKAANQADAPNTAKLLRQLEDRVTALEDKVAGDRLEQLQLMDKITRRLQGRIDKSEAREKERRPRPPWLPPSQREG